MVSWNQGTVRKNWTFTLIYLCLWWRTDSITECILAERGLSKWGSDVRSMSIWAAEWTPNTFCTHSVLTFRPIHRNKWMPFSVTKNTLQKLHRFRGCTVTTQFMTLLASQVHLTAMKTLLMVGNHKAQNWRVASKVQCQMPSSMQIQQLIEVLLGQEHIRTDETLLFLRNVI